MYIYVGYAERRLQSSALYYVEVKTSDIPVKYLYYILQNLVLNRDLFIYLWIVFLRQFF